MIALPCGRVVHYRGFSLPVDPDVGGRELVMIEATRKGHRDAARRARTVLPVGVVVIGGGAAMVLAAIALPVGILLGILIAVLGVITATYGVTLVGRATTDLIHARRRLRELEPPRAVVIDRRS